MSKVLIVDDHPAIRLAVRLLFERDEFLIVGEADNGAEAPQVARKKSPLTWPSWTSASPRSTVSK